MRTTNPTSALAPPPPPPPPPPSGGGRVSQFGVHGLRLVDGVLLDFPLPAPAGARCWVATVWPDHRSPSGWSALAWPPDVAGGRGWRWPPRIAVGDVIEFGVDHQLTRRKVVSARWWGVIADYDGSWLLSVQGTHPGPAHAHEAAGRLIQERLLQVDGRMRPAPPASEGSPMAPHRGRVQTHHH